MSGAGEGAAKDAGLGADTDTDADSDDDFSDGSDDEDNDEGGASSRSGSKRRRTTKQSTCPRPNCGAQLGFTPSDKARHLATVHNIGTFWPCPCRGESLLASGPNRAGPCALEPSAHKHQIKEHLLKRHKQTEAEAAALMAALQPVTRGESEAVDAPANSKGGAVSTITRGRKRKRATADAVQESRAMSASTEMSGAGVTSGAGATHGADEPAAGGDVIDDNEKSANV